jgi:hypothetical protein
LAGVAAGRTSCLPFRNAASGIVLISAAPGHGYQRDVMHHAGGHNQFVGRVASNIGIRALAAKAAARAEMNACTRDVRDYFMLLIMELAFS